MPVIVVPFAGVEGKTRLHALRETRRAVSLAMLGDVLEAAFAVGTTHVVTADRDGAAVARELGAGVLDDPGGGQGNAVRAALAALEADPVVLVNADVPCVRPADLRGLVAATPDGGIALVAAQDGTTNALSLPGPHAFAPLFGPGSAARFREHGAALGLESVLADIPNLADDVDTIEDLQRLRHRVGSRTHACLSELPVEVLR